MRGAGGGPRGVRRGHIHTGADRVYKLLQERLLLLRHPKGQRQRVALQAHQGGDHVVLRAGARAGLSDVRPPGRGRPLFYGRGSLRHRLLDPRRLPRLRHHALHRGEGEGELRGVLPRGREPLPSKARDGGRGALRDAAPGGDVPLPQDAVPKGFKGDRLPDGVRVHGRLARADHRHALRGS